MDQCSPGVETQLEAFEASLVDEGVTSKQVNRYMRFVRQHLQGVPMPQADPNAKAAIGWWTRFQQNRCGSRVVHATERKPVNV